MTDLSPVKIMLKYKTEMEGHFGQYDSLLELNQKGCLFPDQYDNLNTI